MTYVTYDLLQGISSLLLKSQALSQSIHELELKLAQTKEQLALALVNQRESLSNQLKQTKEREQINVDIKELQSKEQAILRVLNELLTAQVEQFLASQDFVAYVSAVVQRLTAKYGATSIRLHKKYDWLVPGDATKESTDDDVLIMVTSVVEVDMTPGVLLPRLVAYLLEHRTK